jgi:hypothetical protein
MYRGTAPAAPSSLYILRHDFAGLRLSGVLAFGAGLAIAGGRGLKPNATCFSQNRALCINCGAGWYPARRLATGAFGLFTGDLGRVNNPPQVSNLPHNFRRVPVSGKSMWHWAKARSFR